MNLGIWCLLAAISLCGADKWQWPEQAASVKIDTKVRFVDGRDDNNSRRDSRVQADEMPFHEASETDGFYNRPPGAGRYPVRVETHRSPYRVDGHSIFSLHNLGQSYQADGTLDSLQYCKCVSTPECNPHHDSSRACGSGMFLCCYKRKNKVNPLNTEYFNEIDDERPTLLPGRENFARPFPPPLNTELNGVFGPGQGHDTFGVGIVNSDMPVGHRGPPGSNGKPAVLVGPAGPSGTIGPAAPNSAGQRKQNPGVLVGPQGPTGVIGPAPIGDDKGVLVEPNGPRDIGASESAQRGILVGPGGPTGIIGPRGYGNRPVLVGPSGPTGLIGPRIQRYFNQYMGGPGVLVGPGGPTGVIGPGRSLLVGPGGPTGLIGPRGYFGK